MSGHLRPVPEGQPGLVEDYFLEIYHSCTLITVYIHLGGLAPEILEVTGEFQKVCIVSTFGTADGELRSDN